MRLIARTLDGELKAEYHCPGSKVVIGRDEECDVVVARSTVSRFHAVINLLENGSYQITDAGSRSGVFVNGVQIDSPRILSNRDKFILGDVVFLFTDQDTVGAGNDTSFDAASKPAGGEPMRRPFLTGKKQAKASEDPYVLLRANIHKILIHQIRSNGKKDENMADEELWRRAELVTNQIIHDKASKRELPEGVSPKALLKDVLDEALGLGPIQDLLADPEVEEIMINGPENVFVARHGRIQRTNRKFIDEERLLTIINRIVAPLGRPITQSTPMVDARLADGSRVNAIIPPVSLVGPVLTIRKFPQNPLRPEDLIEKGAMSPAISRFLRMAVEHRQNILIAGGTGTGKTTLLNAISSFIPEHERIVTIEDSAELQLLQPHVVSLETRPRSLEGTAEVSIRDLVRNSLRMRPDRIIIGECRGGEAVDMLQAMNTGHDGSLTTGHANSCSDMLSRLETMVLTAGLELPLAAVREQIVRAIDLIVHISRFADGSRRIASISEVLGLDGDRYDVREIYRFSYSVLEEGTVEGNYIAMGNIPRFVEELSRRGEAIPLEIFEHA